QTCAASYSGNPFFRAEEARDGPGFGIAILEPCDAAPGDRGGGVGFSRAKCADSREYRGASAAKCCAFADARSNIGRGAEANEPQARCDSHSDYRQVRTGTAADRLHSFA